jgi:hypothetical protein
MKQIIAFAGRKQSGKTTCSEFVANVFEGNGLGVTRIYNFADPLKRDICMNILGLSHEQCYGTDIQKNELVNCYWDGKQLTAREVMQFVGTDVFRSMQNNVWADATIKKISLDNTNLAIIADCRFPNEVDVVKRAGGVVIKLNRNPFNSTHSSETALDHSNYDYSNFDLVVPNDNMTMGEQNKYIYDFLISKGILPL